ncbi:hypothetical protein Anas_13531 [Armadillidium nasatum]|uniref:Uncharacterized protein n=1 Tax=Armadillidium nasatum TaxID=96803 RepID=A0A5N5SUH9_9CRUS|nr:hypothetical protein Anas_13531 [Armadillidium nasatum]
MYDSKPRTVKVHLGDPMILDCRTTRPDIKVNLLINQKQILDNALSYFVKVSRLQYKFDPRVGVICRRPERFPEPNSD